MSSLSFQSVQIVGVPEVGVGVPEVGVLSLSLTLSIMGAIMDVLFPVSFLSFISQSALTRTISRCSVSTMWMAQAMQGSKEWTVRSTSRGLSGSATGLSIREDS